ncbi:MAG: hypothetical protein A2452_10875 [Candidatus Firestonebacteria bacterium RIFOXYC2_FULL_39_67]|nr:MAG: hypothetical protein A2536_08775 [Candidatus Firestonebacteria bacterium RIFOXYD2_FULL_39_29]OGF55959.1 MAG: hypothetical protein A2452_10875 [Candidatus Firestonebacteria bacterium RIFOXYC2_FULL_39_67]OGF56680.1 MAG: hypothetical protein A2497_06165 [Candidatus Firestonebacteria bacterium RifOxyC12_full_39_7]
MKILAIMGNIRGNSQTARAVQRFEEILRSKTPVKVEFEYLFLKDANLGLCRGCALCLSKGEDKCPHKDGFQEIILKMERADGVIFSTPNYSLQVTHLMKNYLDRSAYLFHRPRFFHKISASIVTQGVYGGKKINEYLAQTAEFWGIIPVKGVTLTTSSGAYEPNTPLNQDEKAKADKELFKLAERFLSALKKNLNPSPSFFKLMVFSASRTGHKYNTEENADKKYFREQGWFDSDYYYPVKWNPLKKLVQKFLDNMIKNMSLKKQKTDTLKN